MQLLGGRNTEYTFHAHAEHLIDRARGRAEARKPLRKALFPSRQSADVFFLLVSIQIEAEMHSHHWNEDNLYHMDITVTESLG